MSNVELTPNMDIKIHKNVYVKRYSVDYKAAVDSFITTAISEGNDSYSTSKFHPDNINGQTWMTFVDDELASISAVERSHYTGDPNTAGRICRYHILKKFRHSNAGFRMLVDQVDWAKEQNLKALYWTHNVNNKALNALYQHKRTMPFRGEAVPYFMTDVYQSFKIDPTMIFRVSQKSDLLQYVYVNILEDGFAWKPIHQSIIYHAHNGEITDDIAKSVLGQQH